MPETEQLILALVTGAMFGYFVSLLGSSPQRLALILFALWTLLSGSQQLYRALDGVDVTDELVFLFAVRGTFTAAAVAVVWLAERHHR